MVKKLGILLMFVLLGAEVNSQHLIGLQRDEVMKKLQETTFVIDNSSNNASFKYLKFIDRVEETTLLVFLSNDDICTSTKLMSDYSSLKASIGSFNKKYKKVSSNEWNYNIDNITYKVSLKKEDWFYSVVVTTKTK